MATHACKICGGEAKLGTLGSFRGEAGPVTVIVNGMPALVCPEGHKRFLYPAFVARLMDLVSDPKAVTPQPPARKRGFFTKRYHCHGCDAELPVTPQKKSERSLDASFKDAAPFKVLIQAALHKCEGCGIEQVLSNDEVSKAAAKALANAFRGAEVPPP